jgi:hypothetical protein
MNVAKWVPCVRGPPYRGTGQPLIATIALMFGYVGLLPIQLGTTETLSRDDARHQAGSQP